MITIQLFKDLPNQQSLEPPLEIIVQDMDEVIDVLFRIEIRSINYDWTRIVITKE